LETSLSGYHALALVVTMKLKSKKRKYTKKNRKNHKTNKVALC